MGNCNNNGKTFVVSLTPVLGGSVENANYVLSLDHYTCGNRKLCVSEVFPITADLTYRTIGSPASLGNGVFCCEVLVSGSVTYMPYVCGCNCNICPRTENIYTTICVPCSSATTPAITAGSAVASPTDVKACCNVTNAIAITCSFNVTTP